jgi:hypothetical protein
MIVNLLEERRLNNGRLSARNEATERQEPVERRKEEKEKERNCLGLLLKGTMVVILGG